MQGINDNNKDKYHKAEMLTTEEKQAIIKHYFEDPDEIRTAERNELKIKRIC